MDNEKTVLWDSSDYEDYDSYEVSEFLEGFASLLDEKLDNDIIIVADLGFWNGRHSAYKMLSNDLEDIVYKSSIEEPYFGWYIQDGDVQAYETHHDNTHYYKYRKLKLGLEDEDLQELQWALYNGEPNRDELVEKYTESLKDIVEEKCNW